MAEGTGKFIIKPNGQVFWWQRHHEDQTKPCPRCGSSAIQGIHHVSVCDANRNNHETWGLYSLRLKQLVPISLRAIDESFKGAVGFYSTSPWNKQEEAAAFLKKHRKGLAPHFGKCRVEKVRG